MTKNREFNAATIEDAIDKAAKALGVSADELTYEVIDDGAAGFLGIGARDARVQVRSKLVEHLEPDTTTVENEDVHVSENPDTAPPGSSSTQEVTGEPRPEARQASAEELVEIKSLVTSFVTAMGFDASVDVYDAGEFIAVDVASSETGLFIGPKGETIDALQYLVNAANYKNKPFTKRIILDSEGYRQRRIEAIQGMAHRTARRALRERRRVELPPMSASERRVVHDYLKATPGVDTASEGNGFNRRVTVFPA